jgi:hypothetical protein
MATSCSKDQVSPDDVSVSSSLRARAFLPCSADPADLALTPATAAGSTADYSLQPIEFM